MIITVPWYNFRTDEFDAGPDSDDLHDYIPQDEDSQYVYDWYVAHGNRPRVARQIVMEMCVSEEAE